MDDRLRSPDGQLWHAALLPPAQPGGAYLFRFTPADGSGSVHTAWTCADEERALLRTLARALSEAGRAGEFRWMRRLAS
ncbi:MAG: hypothetical protein JWM27_1831 [Gemmatimonadetes bacterium]|nr:hypothetical protein [Gemmatimonadota bacterium]